MNEQTATTIRLADYQPPNYWVEHVALHFDLHPEKTRVKSTINFRPNDNAKPSDLELDGEELTLISIAIDGASIDKNLVQIGKESLTIAREHLPDGNFTLSTEVEINPKTNTSLNGLYMSNGMFCTQCEAQGFRKITYYPDRPDVMATFDVSVKGDAPVLLSNGNKLDHGVWHDPWPKPAYLFALVAGDLVSYDDTFTTQSGRHVDLQIFVREGDQDKCAYAMDALKRSMRWDETEYGREYDLDLFMIVAVDDFNMGAMENKGLNIFNSKYVLASPETATDRDYELIEAIIAHEYFHNWTGNRITCRDWFQLCLKEGLTVFRDQQFSGDQRSHAVKRIDDVSMLRGRQFREDAGPLAHNVRPEEYIEINNFYTATVYEKGAELIGMLRQLVGPDTYSNALNEYFDRHDGQACTVEDWIKVFEDVSGRDLSQFARWYSQAGTPKVKITCTPSEVADMWDINFEQRTDPTPNQPTKSAMHMPVRLAAFQQDGAQIGQEQVFELTENLQKFQIHAPKGRPIISAFRGFSAPVIIDQDLDEKDRLVLMAHDTDPFNRWEAGFNLVSDQLVGMATENAPINPAILDAYRSNLVDENLDPAFRVMALGMPTEDHLSNEIAAAGKVPDPSAIEMARESLTQAIANHLSASLPKVYTEMSVDGPYTPDAKAAGKRALRSRALFLLSQLDGGEQAQAQFDTADNMTEQLSALATLISIGKGNTAVERFYEQWSKDILVMDKWFAIQVSSAKGSDALGIAQNLAKHADFNWQNPNRFRSLIGPFAMNQSGFHRADGKGYKFVADWLIKLDELNPQTTARVAGVFETWRRFDKDRQALIQAELERIVERPNVSKDTAEILGKILGS